MNPGACILDAFGQARRGILKLNEHFLNKEFLSKFLMLLHAQMLANSVACFWASFAKIQGVLESETQIAFATGKIECEKKGLKAKFKLDYNLQLLTNQLLFCRSH
jgi:hypothetical protein